MRHSCGNLTTAAGLKRLRLDPALRQPLIVSVRNDPTRLAAVDTMLTSLLHCGAAGRPLGATAPTNPLVRSLSAFRACPPCRLCVCAEGAASDSPVPSAHIVGVVC